MVSAFMAFNFISHLLYGILKADGTPGIDFSDQSGSANLTSFQGDLFYSKTVLCMHLFWSGQEIVISMNKCVKFLLSFDLNSKERRSLLRSPEEASIRIIRVGGWCLDILKKREIHLVKGH